MVSDEEMVVIEIGASRKLAKLMDLSETGTLVYLLDESILTIDQDCTLSLYNLGRVFSLTAKTARQTGRLAAFRFTPFDSDPSGNLQSKLIRMEVEWTRLQSLI